MVVGVGNIYASEVLFLSRIHPATPARDVGARKVTALYEAIRAVLAMAVEKAAPPCATFPLPTAWKGIFSCRPRSMAAMACLARIAAQPYGSCARGSAVPITAPAVRKPRKFSEFDSKYLSLSMRYTLF